MQSQDQELNERDVIDLNPISRANLIYHPLFSRSDSLDNKLHETITALSTVNNLGSYCRIHVFAGIRFYWQYGIARVYIYIYAFADTYRRMNGRAPARCAQTLYITHKRPLKLASQSSVPR